MDILLIYIVVQTFPKDEVNDPVRTSCNVVDITKLGAALPVGQLVYSGYLNINADNKSVLY